MNDEPTLSILLLTEDSGDGGFETIEALVQEILRKVVPDARLDKVEMEPTEDGRALRSMRGNYWMGEDRSGEAEFYRRDLIRSIATKLGEGGFVVFHCDGDQPWKKRKKSEKSKKFGKLMEPGIRRLLHEGAKFAPRAIDTAMKRLLLVIPYYSIESWLFQNTDEATRICHHHYAGRDADKFAEWAAERARLDEVEKPKEAVCLKNKHNHGLATANFPFDVVYDVGKSLKQAVAEFERCDELHAALEATAVTT